MTLLRRPNAIERLLTTSCHAHLIKHLLSKCARLNTLRDAFTSKHMLHRPQISIIPAVVSTYVGSLFKSLSLVYVAFVLFIHITYPSSSFLSLFFSLLIYLRSYWRSIEIITLFMADISLHCGTGVAPVEVCQACVALNHSLPPPPPLLSTNPAPPPLISRLNFVQRVRIHVCVCVASPSISCTCSQRHRFFFCVV